jgi:myo-inositol 2-dehydrogenase / D-chiro-inositol 1-dehydrogenase
MNQPPAPPATGNRRAFIKTSSTAAAGGLLLPYLSFPQSAFAENSDTLKVGLVGCGGRGTGAASQALHADKNVVLTAVADTFAGQIDRSIASLRREHGDRIKVTPEKQFVGLDAYRKVLESGVDVVLLASPPGFRPAHLKAAVDAGKHIFCEKPMATDAPGVRSVLESVEASKKKSVSLVAGFCWRYDHARREFFNRLHDGAIGEIRTIYATYYTGPVKPMPEARERKPEWSDVEWQVRNWYNFVWTCGDSLVEQAVHSVDKIAWAMRDTPPLKAVAVGGRQVPAHGGNIYDHFEVNYEYSDGVRAFMGSRQQSGCYNQNADYFTGTKGAGTIGVRRTPELSGGTPWRYTGKTNDMYQTEHDEFFASIRAGKPINDGPRMASSTLLAIMGRMAAYTGLEITWEQALGSEEKLVPDALSWDMKHPVPAIAVPGITRFV